MFVDSVHIEVGKLGRDSVTVPRTPASLALTLALRRFSVNAHCMSASVDEQMSTQILPTVHVWFVP